jgi:hypothetical protein
MQNAVSATLEQAALPYVDYRTSNYRLPTPQIYRRGPAPRPPLAHFILLSMLFHVLLVLTFGAPSGGSREGRAMWGSLQVVLLGPPPDLPPPLRLDRGLPAPRAAPRKAAPAPAPRPEPRRNCNRRRGWKAHLPPNRQRGPNRRLSRGKSLSHFRRCSTGSRRRS